MARWSRRWLDGWLRMSLIRPGRVTLVFLVLGLGAAVLASRLEFRGSFVELLPAEAREVKDLKRVAGKAGGDGYLVVRARGPGPEPLRAFAGRLAPALEALPEVRYVEHRVDTDFFAAHALWMMPLDRLRALRHEAEARVAYEQRTAVAEDLLGEEDAPPDFEALLRKYGPASPPRAELSSRDGSEVYLLVKPTGTAADVAFARRLVTRVQEVAGPLARNTPGIQLDYGGTFQTLLEEDARIHEDLTRAGWLSAMLAVGLILVATRRPWALVVVGVPVGVGVALTFAFAEQALGHLTLVTGFLAAILIGLGLEYGIHLSLRHAEERREHPPAEALAAAVRGTLSGALTSGLINAAAFFVLVFAQFAAFREFGLLAGVGVLLAVLCAYALGPSLLVLGERWRADPRPVPGPRAREVSPARRWPTAALVGVLGGMLGLGALSLWALPRVGFETDLRKLQGDAPSLRLDAHILEETGTSLNPAILLVDGPAEARHVRELLGQVRERHGTASAFQLSASLEDFLPRDIPEHAAEISALRDLVTRLPVRVRETPRVREVTRLLETPPHDAEQLPLEVRRRFEALEGPGRFLLLFPARSNRDTRELAGWASQVDEVREGALARGVDLAVLDSGLIAARLFSLVQADGPFVFCAAAGVVFLALRLSLGSIKRACLVAGPLLLGMLYLAGGMYFLDLRLNFLNAVVLPNLLAIAVDNSVHLFHRYEEEGPGSLSHVVRHTGLAAGVATLSNAAGYGALLISRHEGLKSIGQIALLGVVCTFLGTTVFFPTLLALLERRSEGQGGAGGGAGRVQRLGIGASSEVAVEPGERTLRENKEHEAPRPG